MVLVCTVFLAEGRGQKNQMIQLKKEAGENKVSVQINNQPFTSLLWPDTLEKPVLYPIYAPNNQVITRGYPIQPRPEDTTDHPHHIGLWMNYESVNGLDFWNNSSAKPAAEKHRYGWIKLDSILKMQSGSKGVLTYAAHWHNQQRDRMMNEKTTFVFTATKEYNIIDRYTELKAVQPIIFKDVKDGLLGLRFRRELQIPANNADKIAAGTYITSEGKKGDEAWGTQAAWCMLYGKVGNEAMSVLIIDHPQNFGYPTYWHARGYGLFAANPLGRKVFSNGKDSANLQLKPAQAVKFQYRVVVASGNEKLSEAAIKQLQKEFVSRSWFE